jgi:hypothetical protein
VKITKRQLRRIILEFWDKDVERFLIDNAAEYHRDSSLDAGTIRILLWDDFDKNVGHSEDPADYKKLINQLATGKIREHRYSSREEGNKMKITKRQLRRIIKEERKKLMEASASVTASDALGEAMDRYVNSYISRSRYMTGKAAERKAAADDATAALQDEVTGFIETFLMENYGDAQLPDEEEERKYAAGRPWEHN